MAGPVNMLSVELCDPRVDLYTHAINSHLARVKTLLDNHCLQLCMLIVKLNSINTIWINYYGKAPTLGMGIGKVRTVRSLFRSGPTRTR
jgi:hypothetical protein